MSSPYNVTARDAVTKLGNVSRWSPDARARLEQAALELFAEQGFARTTVPEITARAGLTTRTFFRHFADKREVLFHCAEIPAFAAQLLAEAPEDTDPVTLIREGMAAVTKARFDGRKDEIRLRVAIVKTDDSLQERDLRKRADLSAVIARSFTDRGIPAARLLADACISVLYTAMEDWLSRDDDQPLSALVTHEFEALATALQPFAQGTIIVTRGSRRIAEIGPAPAANGAELLAMLDEAPGDEEFAADVEAARLADGPEAPLWPAD